MNARKTEDSMALLGGALLGAAAMYFMDPQVGRQRRHRVAAVAGGAWDDARRRATNAASHLAGHAPDARGYAQHLADQAQGIASGLTAGAARYLPDARSALHSGRHWGEKWFGRSRDAASQAHDAAHRYADDAAENVASHAREHAAHLRDVASRLWGRARGLVGGIPEMAGEHAEHLRDELVDRSDDWRKRAARGISRASHQTQAWLGHEEHEGFGTATILSSTLGCCMVGAGLMYFLDPKQGRARRTWVGEKTNDCIHQTGQMMRSIGKDLGRRFRGAADETEAFARNYLSKARIDSDALVRRIRSEMNHLSAQANQVQLMADADGTVTVTGNIPRDELDGLLTLLHGVAGVEHVVNRLSVSESPAPRRGASVSAKR